VWSGRGCVWLTRSPPSPLLLPLFPSASEATALPLMTQCRFAPFPAAFEILSSLTALPVAAMLAEDVRPEAEPPSLASFPSPRLAASPPPPQLSPATPDGARVAAAARPAATPFTVMSVAERASRGSRDDSENSGGVANGASGGSGPYRAGSANGDAQSTAAAVVAGPSSQFAQLATPRYAARSHAHHVPVLHALRLPYHIPSRHERQEAYRERLAQLGGEAEASLDDPRLWERVRGRRVGVREWRREGVGEVSGEEREAQRRRGRGAV